MLLHSKAKNRNAKIAKFRKGTVDVLVNVNQFMEGDGVPEIDAVFVARPTTSRRSLMQMIGRGSRLIPTKRHFWIVEFTDEIRSNSDEFFRTSDVIEDVPPPPGMGPSPSRGRPTQHHEPDELELENVELPGLGKLTIARGQTFGVEFELTSPEGVPQYRSPEWRRGAKTLIKNLQQVDGLAVCPTPLGYHQNQDTTRWAVESDSSAGWEVISPILKDAEGLAELNRVCQSLTNLIRQDDRFHINYRTGLHITLGTRLNTDDRLRGFIKRLQRLEPGLMTLVPPSRVFHFGGSRYDLQSRNPFCLPVREAIRSVDEVRLSGFQLHDARYYTVNLAHACDNVEKLEIRLHSGTTDFAKIAQWISLWMLIFNMSRYEWEGDGETGNVFPGGNRGIAASKVDAEDIFHLLRREGIFPRQALMRSLWKRRIQLRSAWVRVMPERVASWEAAGWYENDPPLAPVDSPLLARVN